MATTPTVDRKRLQTISAKYPADRIKLLEAVQERRGDAFVSETVRYALDALVEEHFPGATEAT